MQGMCKSLSDSGWHPVQFSPVLACARCWSSLSAFPRVWATQIEAGPVLAAQLPHTTLAFGKIQFQKSMIPSVPEYILTSHSPPEIVESLYLIFACIVNDEYKAIDHNNMYNVYTYIIHICKVLKYIFGQEINACFTSLQPEIYYYHENCP